MKYMRFRTIAAVIGVFGVVSISGAVAETTETSIKPPFSAASSGSDCSTGAGGALATCTTVDAVDPELGLMSFDLSVQSRLQGYAPGSGSASADASLGHAYSLEGWANQIEISFILEVDR
ncbi:MAG TPA: hypothetical protein VNA87_01030, partial [Actinomycetota bacterium]|nr:hypothetical protein [Actinomycetota bacterium]